MDNKGLNFNEQLEFYNESILKNNFSPEMIALFQNLGELINFMNTNIISSHKKIMSEIKSLKEQVNNIQTSINHNANLSADVKDKINKLNLTLSPALEIVENRKEILTNEELIDLIDNKGLSAKKVAELYNMKEGTVRQRIKRYRDRHKQVNLYESLGKGILDSGLTKQNMGLFARLAGCSVDDLEVLKNGQHKKSNKQ